MNLRPDKQGIAYIMVIALVALAALASLMQVDDPSTELSATDKRGRALAQIGALLTQAETDQLSWRFYADSSFRHERIGNLTMPKLSGRIVAVVVIDPEDGSEQCAPDADCSCAANRHDAVRAIRDILHRKDRLDLATVIADLMVAEERPTITKARR